MKKNKQNKRSLKREFQKSLSTGIIVSFGIIVALAWRDVLDGYIVKLFEFSPLNGKIFAALLITFIAAGFIVIISRFNPAD